MNISLYKNLGKTKWIENEFHERYTWPMKLLQKDLAQMLLLFLVTFKISIRQFFDVLKQSLDLWLAFG